MSTIQPSQLSVVFNGPFLSHSGFSKCNREIALRLAKAGVRVKTDIIETKVDVEPRIAEAVRKLTKTVVPSGTPLVFGMTMPAIISNAGPRILLTMMESSNEVHPEYAEKMNLASEIWVPTSHMSDMLTNAGVCTPVHVVPLGVDQKVFSASAGRMSLPKSATNMFRFLSVSWWGPRKGFDLLIKAFVGEFSKSDKVCLIISSRTQDGKPSSWIIEQIRNTIKATGKTDRPPVVLHSGVTTDQQLAALYNSCQAFVLASRGEGFSLPIVEAGSCGLPVISTRCTAQATYLDDDNSYLVDPEGYERANPRDGRTNSVGRWCKFYENQPFPIFSGQSIRKLGSLMREVYEDRVTARAKAENFTEKVRSSMTWDSTVNKVIERLYHIEKERKQ